MVGSLGQGMAVNMEMKKELHDSVTVQTLTMCRFDMNMEVWSKILTQGS